MPAIVLAVGVLILYALGYRFYSTYLAKRVYALDPAFVTPAHEFQDGIDFVPTNRHILFGHHFTSVAGAAPIVGPAIAVIWGWGPALAWIVIGTIFFSGAHDFGSIVVSVRNRARNIGTLTADVINKRSRTLFLLIIFFLLTLVNAVFAIVIANLFIAFPGVVIPIMAEIPIALAVGQYVYRKRTAALGPSILGVIVLYALIPVGAAYPIDISGIAEGVGLTAHTLWVILLFAYAGIASRVPVWILLQPRDYINSHQLFIALGVIFLGVAIGMNQMVAPVYNASPEGAPPWFPFLFITIACGAISGFHCLVGSGTTSKQLDKETDARFVGYMGSLGEGSLALGSVLATSAGIAIVGLNWGEQYTDWGTAAAGGVGNFVQGVAGFANNLGVPVTLGAIFAALVVISFAATTLDSGVRLQRYILQEIGEIVGVRWMKENLGAVTVLAVLLPFGLALTPGDLAFGRLWTLFGTTNQLTAGLALSVIAVWVLRNRRNPLAQVVPLTFLLIMTSWALIRNTINFVRDGDWLLGPLNIIIFALAIWLIVEAVIALRRGYAARDAATVDSPSGTSGT